MLVDNVAIIVAGIEHAQQLTKLCETTFRDTFGIDNKQEDMDKYIADEMNLDRITDELKDNKNIFFLACHNGIPVGYAKLRATKIPEQLKNNNPIEIERLYVLQSYHGKKIGAAIMDRCIAHALTQGNDLIWLGVWEHNHKAMKFYMQYGFELFGSHIFMLGNDQQTDMLMKKTLK